MFYSEPVAIVSRPIIVIVFIETHYLLPTRTTAFEEAFFYFILFDHDARWQLGCILTNGTRMEKSTASAKGGCG